MDVFQALVLAILQGLTEFLPISSSAHLVIPSLILDWPDQGLAFDVAVHVGTLTAVLVYYCRDLLGMAKAWLLSLTGGGSSTESRMVWYLAFATIPAGLAGVFLGDLIEAHARNLPVIATTTLVFGILLGMADRYAIRVPGDAVIGWRQAMLIGAAQALALVPGVSRSGVTITAGLFLNLSRQDAARFSFLLSIPVIAGAGLIKAKDLAESGYPVDWTGLGIAALVSGVTAFSCITVFLRLLDRVGMMPFVYYRLALALLLYVLWLV